MQERFRPIRPLSVSDWADRFRVLPDDSAMKGGRWSTAFTPYLRDIMNSFLDADIEETVVLKSAQVGFSEALVNIILYVIYYGAGSILHVHPKEDAARKFSLKRLMPSLAREEFFGKIAPAKSRDSGNTILSKRFVGGDYIAVGANSPDNLASNPVPFGLLDEYDRIAQSSGREGAPLELVKKRTTTFWNRKIFVGSTPTDKATSNIMREWDLSDKRRYFIPCAGCGELWTPTFPDIVWENDTRGHPVFESARLRCPHCARLHTNVEKNEQVRDPRSRWIATAESKGKAGFHINQILSPFTAAGLSEIVKSYTESKGDPLKMQVFVNTVLGEAWEDAAEKLDANALALRAEDWQGNEVPRRALVLTVGADTQPDRIEAECVAWGAGEESWSIEYRVIFGDPTIPEGSPGSPWDAFTAFCRKSYRHESGVRVTARRKFIDSGGSNTIDVYKYAAAHRWENVFAIKGANTHDAPIVGAVQRRRIGERKTRGVKFVLVGTHKIKDIVVGRFGIDTPGNGYCHFPIGRGNEWFEQLTSEHKVVKYEKGRAKIEWIKDAEKRNEALDCRVYAFAALRLDSPDWQREAYLLKQRAATESGEDSVVKESLTTQNGNDEIPAVRKIPERAPAIAPEQPDKPTKSASVLSRLSALRRRR